MIRLSELVVTQHGLRNPGQVDAMRRFVKLGGYFTKDAMLAFAVLQGGRPPRLMRVALTPDGAYLCDGLHRAVAIHLGGRDHIDDGEYTYSSKGRGDFTSPDLDQGWYTPFDPETEVRRPEFGVFRSTVEERKDRGHAPESIIRFIADNHDAYAQPRRYTTIERAAAEYAAA